MTERSLWVPALLLAPVAATVFWQAINRLEASPPWLLIATFASLAVAIADWPHWVARKVVWSNTATVAIAACVLAPPSTRLLSAMTVMAATAFYAPERRDFQVNRFITNLGLLTMEGLAIGLSIDFFGQGSMKPSGRLVAAATIAWASSALVALVAITAITAYRFGRKVVRDHLRVAVRLPMSEAPIAVSVALTTSAVHWIGPDWILPALAYATALISLPVARAQLAAHRTDLISMAIDALNRRDLVPEPHERMEEMSMRAGRYLGFSEDQLQQLRYVCLTYSMTELFANELPIPIDQPPWHRKLTTRVSRVLFYGLALDDVADSAVNQLGDATARLDALMFPEEGDQPMLIDEAIDELQLDGVTPNVLEALRIAAADDGRELGPRAALPLGFGQPDQTGRRR